LPRLRQAQFQFISVGFSFHPHLDTFGETRPQRTGQNGNFRNGFFADFQRPARADDRSVTRACFMRALHFWVRTAPYWEGVSRENATRSTSSARPVFPAAGTPAPVFCRPDCQSAASGISPRFASDRQFSRDLADANASPHFASPRQRSAPAKRMFALEHGALTQN
jgi:hypothetical protein